MNFSEKEVYHIYNRGNDKQAIFFDRENYLYFLKLSGKFLYPHCQILAWCLMPNHFHFMVYADVKSIEYLPSSNLPLQKLSESFKMLLSSYTKAINKRYGKKGNLFQQRTKSKSLYNGQNNYVEQVFNYIHQNPVKAQLTEKMEDWEFSSYRDFAGLRDGRLCNRELALQLLDLEAGKFIQYSAEFYVSETKVLSDA